MAASGENDTVATTVAGPGGAGCETARQIEVGRPYANGRHPRSLIMVGPDSVSRILGR